MYFDFLTSKRKEIRIQEHGENEKLCVALLHWKLHASHLQATPASISL